MTHALTFARARQHLTREEGVSLREQKSGHTSVLIKEVLKLLDLKDGETVVDATSGMGGHGEAILKTAKVSLIALDADKGAVAASGERLKHARVIEANFRDLGHVLKKEGVEKVNKILFDLGWNMTQLSSGRGFSFLHDEPLNMSYGEVPASGFTAAEILNTWNEKAIADALFGYGEERYARRIAKAVVLRRTATPITTTIELVEIVKDAVPPSYRHGRIHPATRTFQALRIAVNDELVSLEKGIEAAWKHLAPRGRIVVITFHSIEDRIVKRYFKKLASMGEGSLIGGKKPLTATQSEITMNPSARSAKLRAIEKICDDK